MRLQARDASSRARALDTAIRVHEREQELERVAAIFREAGLEERIGAYERDAQIMADRITTLEAENQHLRDQATSFGPDRDLWTFTEAHLDVYKRLWEAGIVPEAAFEEAHQKAREARLDCGFDPATPGVDDGAEGADDVDGGAGGAESKRICYVFFLVFIAVWLIFFCCCSFFFFLSYLPALAGCKRG